MKNIKKLYIPAMALLLIANLGFAASASAAESVDTNTGVNINANTQVGLPMMFPGGRGGGQGERGGHGGVFGTVTAVSGATITVTNQQTGTVYTVDSTNAKIDKNRTTITASGIAVGDSIFVEGTTTGTSVVASAIHDGVMLKGGMGGGMPGGNPIPGVSGVVTAVSGNTITITAKQHTLNSKTATSTTYTIDATNASVQKAGAVSSVSGIAVGDTINAQGTITGTTVVATKINDGRMMQNRNAQDGTNMPEGNGQPVIAGTVTAVSGSTITITNKSNVAYTIDASAAKITKGDAAGTAASIAVGDVILAQGTVNGTSVTAVTVNDQGVAKTAASEGFFSRIGGFFAHLFGF